MGEYTERWRQTHNWLARFGDDLLSLRDCFKAAGEAEALLEGKEGAVAALDAHLTVLTDEIEVKTQRLSAQSELVLAAEADLALRKKTIDEEVDAYRLDGLNKADLDVQKSHADLVERAKASLVTLDAEIMNKAANRDALAGEVADRMDTLKRLDHDIAERAAKVAALDARLAEIAKFAQA